MSHTEGNGVNQARSYGPLLPSFIFICKLLHALPVINSTRHPSDSFCTNSQYMCICYRTGARLTISAS